MTVSSTSRKVGPFNGNDVATSFPFTIKVFTTADLQLTLTDASGAQTVLVLDSDYSVTLNADQDNNPGGTITYPLSGAPLATGERIDGLDVSAVEQPTDITNLGNFLPQVFEDAFDRVVIFCQQLLEKVNRSLKFPIGDTASTTLPSAEARAGKALVFDNDGNIATSVELADLSAALAAADADAAAAAGSAGAAAGSASAAAGSASAAAGSASAAATSAANAATSEANAAVSEDNAAAESMLFSTATAGLAAAASGQLFGVQQTYGEAADIYLDNAGTAVSQNRTIPATGAGQRALAIQVAELASANLTPYPVAPYAEFYGVDTYNKNGRYIPGRQATAAPGSNIIPLCSGGIAIDGYGTSVSVTVDQNYANGPGGAQTAARITLPDNTFWSPFRGILPAGTYTFKVQLQAAPGTTPTVKTGDQTVGGLANTALTDSVWTTVTVSFTATGSNVQWPIVFNQSGATVQIMVDRIQFYAGASVPAWSDPPAGELRNVVPQTGIIDGQFVRAGAVSGTANAIDTTGGVVGGRSAGGTTGGAIRLSTYPLAKSVSEMTFVAVCASDDTTIGQGKVIGDPTDAVGNLNVAIWLGQAQGAPAQDGSQGKLLKMTGNGYHVLISRAKASEQSFIFDGIEYARKTTAWGPLTMSQVRTFCDSKQDRFFKGKTTVGLVFEKWLTDSEIATVIQSVKQRHALFGEPPVDTGYRFIFAEGDSITDRNATSGGYVTMYFNTNPPRVFGKNNALSGSTFALMNARIGEITRMAPQVLSYTGKPMIVSPFIGANGIPTQLEISTYYANCRAAGAKVIAFTLLPIYGDATFETNRIAYNSWIRANPSMYDALCDFGDTSSVMGNPNSYTLTPANWNDTKHPSVAGHQNYLMPTWKTAVESLFT